MNLKQKKVLLRIVLTILLLIAITAASMMVSKDVPDGS